MSEGLLSLPLELQVALGGGYLAHAVAYGGLRRSTGATELALRSLAFGLISLMVMREALLRDTPVLPSVGLALFAAMVAGAFWRRFGMTWSVWLLSRLGISREDGVPDAWAALIQTRNVNVTQMSVHTKDGRILFHDRSAYDTAWNDGLYFGSDGSIVMVVAEERLPDGTDQTRTGLSDPAWGTRLTYIPADQIARVNMRVTNATL